MRLVLRPLPNPRFMLAMALALLFASLRPYTSSAIEPARVVHIDGTSPYRDAGTAWLIAIALAAALGRRDDRERSIRRLEAPPVPTDSRRTRPGVK